MKTRNVACMILLAAAFAAPVSAQPTLRYKFKVGEKRTYVTDQKMTIKMNVNGMDIDTKVDQMFEMIWEVKKIDDKGDALMEMRMGRVKLTIESFNGSFEVDSANLKDAKDDTGKVLNQVVETLATTRVTLKKNALGEVSDVEIPEEVRKKLDAIPNGGLGGGTDASTMAAMTQGGVVFPKMLGKDKTWNQTQKLKLPFGKLNSEIKYTYEGQEQNGDRKVEKITMVPEIKIEPDMDAKLKIALKKSEGKGSIQFDNKAGVTLEQTLEMTMQLEVEVAGMTFTQNIVQNTTVRLKDGK